MCRGQGSPAFCLANPLVEIAFMGIDAGLDAQFTGVATGLPGVTAQALDVLAHLIVRLPLRKPAIADPCYTSQQRISTSTQPDRDGTTHRQRIKTRLSYSMKPPFVTDDFLTPEQAHNLDLFLHNTPPRVKVHAQGLVLYWIPTYAHTKAYLTAGEHSHLRSLLGHKRCLSLGKDHNCRNHLQLRQRRQVAKKHKRLVKQIQLSISLPARTMYGICPQDMVKYDHVTVAHSLCCLGIVANGCRVGTNLILRKRESYLHISIPLDLAHILYSWSF